jgi:hypothetical protein
MRRTIVGSTEEHYGRWMSAFREDDTGVQRSFDDLASGLASGTISRRRALKLAGASLLGAAGLFGAANPAQAAPTPTCPRRGAGCFRKCKNTRKLCSCIRTVSDSRRCVYPCCSGRPCGQCRSGEVCMRTNCCGPQPTCVTPCDRRRPNYCGGGGAAATQSTGSAVWS